jgi:hypothetical protein
VRNHGYSVEDQAQGICSVRRALFESRAGDHRPDYRVVKREMAAEWLKWRRQFRILPDVSKYK